MLCLGIKLYTLMPFHFLKGKLYCFHLFERPSDTERERETETFHTLVYPADVF